MTKTILQEGLKDKTTDVTLYNYLAGLTESDIKAVRYAVVEKHAKKYGIDITSGKLGELLKPAKMRAHFELVGNAAIPKTKWLVKKVKEQSSLTMIFGDSGTCKSFIAIAMAACTALGKDFYGYDAKKCTVLYIASEGSGGLTKRFRAWAQENKTALTDALLYRYTSSVNLTLPDAATVLKESIGDVIDEDALPALAIIDTWSRSLGGDDSDTSSAALGLQTIDSVRARFPGLAVMLVHHTGHGNKERARGASLLHAAVDTEYRVEKQKDGIITFTNTKNKEGELLLPMAFRPRRVELLADDGKYMTDEDGEIETSLVLERIEYVPEEKDGMGKNQQLIIEILQGTEDKNIAETDLLETFKTRKKTMGQYYHKGNFDDAIRSLEGRGRVYKETGFVCLA